MIVITTLIIIMLAIITIVKHINYDYSFNSNNNL